MNESARARALALLAFLALAAAAVYGFRHEHLPQQPLWSPRGQSRFLAYAAVYWAAAGILLLAVPRWFGAAAAVFVLIYTAWWSGPAAPVAVLYLFGACYLTGKIFARPADAATATLLGLSAAILAIWIALHFRVNYRSVYAAVLAVPYAWEGRRWRKHMGPFRIRCDTRREAAALALLLFVLLAQWLVALNPEISDDGLAMHLAAPLAVLHDGRWGFDFRQYTWALMPAGGECVYTAAVVLGSHTNVDAAPKLANFALLAIIAILIVQTARRWLTPARSLLAAALFVSTPVVQLVTGSLFVENLWAVMILGASAAVLRYADKDQASEVYIAGALLGTALAVKMIAALFLVPAALAAGWFALQKKRLPILIPAAALAVIAAAPPYLYAFLRSGNPAYPWLNTIFHSPYFDTQHPFIDGRFLAPFSWLTPYLVTFRSGNYIEGQAGAAGFQYFLLFLPAAILAIAARHRAALVLLGIASVPALALLIFVPNLRYTYPAMPLVSIALGIALARIPGSAVVLVVLTALNCWFQPASGWYQKDFGVFTRVDAADYEVRGAGERILFERLNQGSPGQPVGIFDSDFIAGLDGRAYTNSWHTYDYWQAIAQAPTPAAVAGILRQRGIHDVIAPASLQTSSAVVDTFLRQWLEPDGAPAGRMALFRLRDAPALPRRAPTVLPPGQWDDLDERIEYSGNWLRGDGFDGPIAGTSTYSGAPGDSLRLSFSGSGITYIFAKAFNRGIAQVSIDGKRRARIDMYSPKVEWQSQRAFTGLGPGTHVFEVRILPEKNPAARQTFVDLDAVVVTP